MELNDAEELLLPARRPGENLPPNLLGIAGSKVSTTSFNQMQLLWSGRCWYSGPCSIPGRRDRCSVPEDIMTTIFPVAP